MITRAQLRGARAMLNWSADELARRSKISRHAIGKIERGRTNPQRATIAAIVNALIVAGVQFQDGGVRLTR